MWFRNIRDLPARSWLLFISFGLFLGLVYGPYVRYGEFTYDDWSVGNLAVDCPGLVTAYRCYWPSFSNRPLAPIYYSLTTNLFGVNVADYILANLVLWLGAIILLASIFRKTFSSLFAWIFVCFASVPALATTVIFSPGMQSIGSVSLFIWSLSLWFLERFCQKGRQRFLVASHFMVLASLLTYEVSLPLLSLSMTWPELRNKANDWQLGRKDGLRYVLIFVAPLAAVIFLALLYQKLLVTLFLADISRFRITSFKEFRDISISVKRLLGEIGRSDLPDLLISGFRTLLKEAHRWSWIALGVGVGLFWYGFGKTRPKLQGSWLVRRHLAMFLFSLLAYYGVVVLFTSARIGPTVQGYLNRGLSSSALLLAIFLAYVGSVTAQKYWWLAKIGLTLLFMGYLAAFLVQRDHYLAAGRLVNRIIVDVTGKLEEQSALRDEAETAPFVIGNVPEFLTDNFNDETVFSDEVGDWGLALKLKSRGRVKGGVTVTKKKLKTKGRAVNDQEEIIVDGYRLTAMENLWFYSYDQVESHSELMPIAGKPEVEAVLERVADDPYAN